MTDGTLIKEQGKLEMLWTSRWQEQKCENKKCHFATNMENVIYQNLWTKYHTHAKMIETFHSSYPNRYKTLIQIDNTLAQNYQLKFNVVILNQDVLIYAKDPLTGLTDNKSPKIYTKSLVMKMRESFFHITLSY